MNKRTKEYPLVVGDVRPSQMMYTYGVGSIVDLPNLSVLVMGLDDWRAETQQVIEPRLLNAVRFHPGLRDVQEMRELPRSEDEGTSGFPFTPTNPRGAPVAIFPRWWVCPVCRQLAPISSGVFQMSNPNGPPDKIMYRHTGCTVAKGKSPQAIPARILVACENGHLDDFPWSDFVHRGEKCTTQSPTFKLEESGVSGEVRDLEVRCSCGARRRLADAFGKENRKRMPKCTGRRPHLRDYEDTKCDKHMRPIALGASNLWFPVSLTVLSIPQDTQRLAQLVEENWANLQQADSPKFISVLRQANYLSGEIADYDDQEIFAAIVKYRNQQDSHTSETFPDIKLPEYTMFCEAIPRHNSRDFQLRRLNLVMRWDEYGISDVVLAERLREVQAMVGFARLDAVGELTDPGQQAIVRAAPLSRRSTNWVPATETRGEGIFLRFDEDAISAWEHLPELREHTEAFFAAHTRWREMRGIQDASGHFPGMRYVLLHSFSHALMRQIALEVGYSASSLKERIYARPASSEGGPMAGVLIYTAAPDSEGTLGGLIGLAEKEENIFYLVHESLKSMTLCASDPLCAERTVESGGHTVHAAACHTCLFAPETSCERGNRYLDRAVLVNTIDSKQNQYAFFKGISL